MALLAVATLLTGCRLEVVAGVVVERSGGGTAQVTFTLDEPLLAELDRLGVDPTAELTAAVLDEPAWTVQRSTTPDDGLEVRLERTADDLDELADAWRGLRAGLAPDDPAIEIDLALRRDEDGATRVEGRAGLRAPTTAGATLDGRPVGPDAEALRALVDEHVRAALTVTLPGEVGTHDADVLVGRTARWDLAVGRERTITAEAAPPGTAPEALLVATAVVVLLLAAGALWWWRRRATG